MPNHHTTKLCRTCERTLAVESFHRNNRPAGRASNCKDCKRNWRKNTKAGQQWEKQSHRISKGQWQKRNRHKTNAHLAVFRAVKRGDLVKTNCSVCGSAKQVEGHHHNGYERQLEVDWLCNPHHRLAHIGLR